VIYRLDKNVQVYHDFDLDPFELIEALDGKLTPEEFDTCSWDLKSLAGIWPNISAEFIADDGAENNSARPDLTLWNEVYLVLSPHAYECLCGYLKPFGEFLDVSVNDEKFKIFNCLDSIRADKSRSSSNIVNGVWQGLKSLHFIEEETASKLIFKTRFDRCSTLFCTREFVSLVDVNCLSGLVFSEDLIG
jgi:hypothetical protein